MVLGALLLGLLYVLMNDTVMPGLTEQITGIFDVVPNPTTGQ